MPIWIYHIKEYVILSWTYVMSLKTVHLYSMHELDHFNIHVALKVTFVCRKGGVNIKPTVHLMEYVFGIRKRRLGYVFMRRYFCDVLVPI